MKLSAKQMLDIKAAEAAVYRAICRNLSAAKHVHPAAIVLFDEDGWHVAYGADAVLLTRLLKVRLQFAGGTMPFTAFGRADLEASLGKLLKTEGVRVAVLDHSGRRADPEGGAA